MQCVEMIPKGNKTFLIKGKNARLCNLIFEPQELGVLSVRFNFLTKKITAQPDYKFHVIQTDYADDEVIGTYIVKLICNGQLTDVKTFVKQ